jgi:hypothetical protein
MKLKICGITALVVVVLLFIGPNTSGAELEDITTIVGDTEISGTREDTTAEDAGQILSETTDPFQEQNETFNQHAFELENNNQSDHFEHRHQFVPEPASLVLLTLGGLCLLRRKG